MADVRVYLPYHVSGLWVPATVLGGAATVERNGYRMTLRLPEHPRSFERRSARSPGPLGEAFRVSYHDPSTPPYDWMSVSVVEVECEVHVPGVADERRALTGSPVAGIITLVAGLSGLGYRRRAAS
jgi:hypothetical protein